MHPPPHYLQKKFVPVLALFGLGNKLIAIYLTFTLELRLPIRPTDIKAQKIDGNMLDIYRIIVTVFLVFKKANWVKFFEEIFLIANVSLEVILEMLFFTLSTADINFLNWELCLRTYTTKKTLPTTRHIELVDKKEFIGAALDPEHKTFLIDIASLGSAAFLSSIPLDADIHLFHKPQISSWIVKEVPTKISNKYVNFADVFSPNLTSELLKHTKSNNHTIKLNDGEQTSYGQSIT